MISSQSINIFNEKSGTSVRMITTNPLHFSDERKTERSDDVAASFGEVLMKAVSRVNDLQVDAEDMTRKMISEPETVDIHKVMIATQKAEIAINLTKAVRDEAIRAYRELINLR